MNETWQEITTILHFGHMPIIPLQILAQAPGSTPLEVRPGQAVDASVNYVEQLIAQLINFIPSLLAALAILLVGLLVAAIAAAIVRGILNRTNIDNRIAAGVIGSGDRRDLPQVENVISSLVFWVIVLFTLVAVLQALNLQVVSQPLNAFLNQILGFIPKLVGAAILFAIAWVVATLVKLVTTRGLHALRLDQRLNQQPETGTTTAPNQLSLADTIGNALYWFIFLLFLLPILNALDLNQALLPVQTLITQIFSILPNILAAVLIAGAGWLLATVVQRIVTNLLSSAGIDRLGAQFGLQQSTSRQSLSGIIGTIVYVLILIPVAIAALNALRIDAISVPAIAMLQQILNALPAIFTAALVLIVAYFVGRFVGDLVTNILSSLGFDNIFSVLGLPTVVGRRAATPPRDYSVPASAQNTVLQPDAPTTRTPSEIVGIVVLVGIMLFATVAAVDILNIPALTALMSGIVVIFGRILAGLVVFAVGLFLANLAFNIITSSGDRQSQILGQIARIAIIALVSAMALQQIGVASSIVNLAFGLLLGAIAVAIALAFGLGSRDIAAEQVRELLASFKGNRNQPPRM